MKNNKMKPKKGKRVVCKSSSAGLESKYSTTHNSTPNGDREEIRSESSGLSDSSDTEYLENLPFMMYMHVKVNYDLANILDHSNILKIRTQLLKCKELILSSDKKLQTLLNKAKTRDPKDGKVPPGSNDVERHLLDDRYLLSRICVDISYSYFASNEIGMATAFLQEALLWFPRSADGCLSLAKILKSEIQHIKDSEYVRNLLKRAAAGVIFDSAILERCHNLGQYDAKVDELSRVAIGDEEVVAGDDDIKGIVKQIHQRAYAEEGRATREALSLLALDLCQEGNFDHAVPHLKALKFTWRLSKFVLKYPLHTDDYQQYPNYLRTQVDGTSDRSVPPSESQPIGKRISTSVHIIDKALPLPVLSHLCSMFRPTSPYWQEHQYDPNENCSRLVGYYSYIYPYKHQRAAGNFIEQVIDYLLPAISEKFPRVKDEATVGKNFILPFCMFPNSQKGPCTICYLLFVSGVVGTYAPPFCGSPAAL